MSNSLKNSKMYRGGVTSPYRNMETNDIFVTNTSVFLRLQFSISSKGGGNTQILVDINRHDFGSILDLMLETDRQTAMKCMSIKLHDEINKQPAHDKNLIAQSRRDVSELAREKYVEAPAAGSDDVERLVLIVSIGL